MKRVRPQRLLDFGCWNREILTLLKEQNSQTDVYGLVFSSKGAGAANEREFRVAIGDRLGSLYQFGKKPNDLNSMFQVLEDRNLPIKIVIKILSEQGSLILVSEIMRVIFTIFKRPGQIFPPTKFQSGLNAFFLNPFPNLSFV